jgi:hypothetical protein
MDNKIESKHFGKLCNSKTKPYKNTLIGRMTCVGECKNFKASFFDEKFVFNKFVCSDFKNAIKEK